MDESLPTLWHCPGEAHPISRAVHLARLASGFAACVSCSGRHDPLTLPSARRRLQIAEQRPPATLFRTNGLRGLTHNVLTPERLAHFGSIVADLLWEKSPRPVLLTPRQRTRTGDTAIRPALCPRVVVGHDHRDSSPALALALVRALRRAGCSVTDVGNVHRPAFDYAIDHFHGDAGLFITGGGCPGDWNGLEIVSAEGITWSLGGRLDAVRERADHLIGRPSRTMGPCRTASIMEAYSVGLTRHFHGLRPLRVSVHSASPVSCRILIGLVDRLPGRITITPAAVPFGEESAPHERVQRRLEDEIHREHLDLGVLITSDGRGCFLLDERGELIGAECMLAMLAASGSASGGDPLPLGLNSRPGLSGQIVPAMTVCVPPADIGEHDPGRPAEESLIACETLTAPAATEESLLSTQLDRRLPLACDRRGRYWRADASPRCDALVTLGQSLQFLSRSDLPPSLLLRQWLPWSGSTIRGL